MSENKIDTYPKHGENTNYVTGGVSFDPLVSPFDGLLRDSYGNLLPGTFGIVPVDSYGVPLTDEGSKEEVKDSPSATDSVKLHLDDKKEKKTR